MISLRDEYDWVVLGDSPGGLLSACLVARLGFSVIVLPLKPSRLTALSRSGQYHDPEPNLLLGLGRIERANGLLAECLQSLGVRTVGSRAIRGGAAALPQVLTPLSRLSLAVEDDDFATELLRELGPDRSEAGGFVGALAQCEGQILSYWNHFPERFVGQSRKGGSRENGKGARGRPTALEHARDYLAHQGFGAKKGVRGWLSRKEKLASIRERWAGGPFADLCEGLWYAVSGNEGTDPLLLDLVHAVVLARTGASFRGGITAFRYYLRELAAQLGAHVPDGINCRRVFVEDGRLFGVQTTDGGRMIAATAGILGTGLSQAREYLVASGRVGLRRLKPAPAASGWRFTLALTVREGGIPPGMGSRAVWKEHGAPALEIEIADPAEYGMGATRERYVFARTWLPFTQESLEVGAQRVTAARMFRQLTEILPFLDHHVVRVFPDFRRPAGAEPDDFSEAYGYVSPSMIPANLRLVDGEGVGSFSGVDGLHVASGESYPSLGSFGDTVAAVEAVAQFVRNQGAALPPQAAFRSRDFWELLRA